MKNSVLNLVKGGVFLLAMIAAFAFTTPTNLQDGFGAERNEDGDIVAWHDVSQLSPSEYECNASEYDCIYTEDDENSTALEPGTFELTNP
ncbi:hypothetical protein [Echinicola rosea]|uniref:Uncharacterized protein n=1 Tax=Echinicola rosea TaxID=1807691 RepID=A0ABQ1V8R2_9BACT|nr:hypothetical protein [Echinicola rosea]GGF44337.1 hypothetical protein GCM10011339_36030 [Echinicola rosea]